MKKHIGSKKPKTEEDKIVKLITSGLAFQFFLSMSSAFVDMSEWVFVIYNIYIWTTYFIIKKISTNILEYNVYNLYFILNIVPIFLYLLLIMMAIDNIAINLIILVPVLILPLIIRKVKITDFNADNKKNKISAIIIGGSLASITRELIDENEILNGILFVSGLYLCYGLIFYILRLAKVYEESKLNDGN